MSAQRNVMEALEELVKSSALERRFRGDRRFKHLEKHDIQDLQQDFIAALLRRIAKKGARVVASPRAYIRRAAHNYGTSYLRRAASPKQRELKVVYIGDYDPLIRDLFDDGRDDAVKSKHSADERVVYTETHRIVMQAMERMPPRRGRVFRMVSDGMPLPDVAALLNIKLSTATNHYRDAQQDVLAAVRAEAVKDTRPPQEPPQ